MLFVSLRFHCPSEQAWCPPDPSVSPFLIGGGSLLKDNARNERLPNAAGPRKDLLGAIRIAAVNERAASPEIKSGRTYA